MASKREGKLINRTDILEKERMQKTSQIETVPMVRKRLPYIQYSCGTWGIESAAWVNEVGALNEFPEARDDSSILHSGKALLTSWNGPVADP